MRLRLTIAAVALAATFAVAPAAYTAPLLAVNPTSFEFTAVETGGDFWVRNDGDGTLDWSITSNQSWLGAAPVSGTLTAGQYVRIQISLDRTGVPDGIHYGELAVTSNGGSRTVTVCMVVQEAPKLNGGGGTTFLSEAWTGDDIPIWNTGVGVLEWSAGADQPWIVVSPPLSGAFLTSSAIPSRSTSTPARCPPWTRSTSVI